MRPLSLLSVHELTERVVAVLDARARARHGWAPIDAWNMCSSVPRGIGQQLAWLAEEGLSWPHTPEFPTPQSWKDTLRYHALILTTDGYGDAVAEQRLLDNWCEAEDAVQALATRKDSSTEQLAAARAQAEHAFTQMRHGEDLAAASVVGSMTWVAEHIHHLWD